MTIREFYNAVAAGTMTEEIMAKAAEQIEKMDTAAEKRKGVQSKKAAENQPLVDRIVNEILGEEPVTATDVAGILEVSVQKASMLCRAAVAQGKATQTEVKLPKKGTMKAYCLVTA